MLTCNTVHNICVTNFSFLLGAKNFSGLCRCCYGCCETIFAVFVLMKTQVSVSCCYNSYLFIYLFIELGTDANITTSLSEQQHEILSPCILTSGITGFWYTPVFVAVAWHPISWLPVFKTKTNTRERCLSFQDLCTCNKLLCSVRPSTTSFAFTNVVKSLFFKQ